ncbi:hypothetical protein H4Q26_011298 [Puccinia striiformis f. sp. tritici PST-130]|nr:hypothetical protein H4Q26_011298 [Puccinia striiformis f. sp. tritici PST-130]
MDGSFVDLLLRRDIDHCCLATGTHMPILNRSSRSLRTPLTGHWESQSSEKRLQEQRDSWRYKRTRLGVPFTAHPIQSSHLASRYILLQKLSLVNSKEKIAPGSVSGHTLEKTTRQILKSCVKSVSEKEANTNDKDSLKIDQQQVVMLISKAE